MRPTVHRGMHPLLADWRIRSWTICSSQERQYSRLEDVADLRWQVGSTGSGLITLDDIVLVSIHHVSLGSWQPHLRLKHSFNLHARQWTRSNSHPPQLCNNSSPALNIDIWALKHYSSYSFFKLRFVIFGPTNIIIKDAAVQLLALLLLNIICSFLFYLNIISTSFLRSPVWSF